MGIIQNFNKDASVVNQFFPTMLKTKISIGKSAENGLSIYDHFSDPELEEKFVHIMKRAVKRDSMYSWSRSIVDKRDENPFWNGQGAIDFIKDVHKGNVFVGKYSGIDIWISKVNVRTIENYGTFNKEFVGSKNLYLTAEQVQQLKDDGYLNNTQISNINRIEESHTSEAGTTNSFLYQIRWYEKDSGIFPKILQVFRLSCGQLNEVGSSYLGRLPPVYL